MGQNFTLMCQVARKTISPAGLAQEAEGASGRLIYEQAPRAIKASIEE
jgi:hypothetical protein